MIIGEFAFKDCSSLTSVTIPNGITTIGESAFEGCSPLATVTIPNSIKKIGKLAFDCAKIIWLPKTPPDGYRNVVSSIHYVANDLYTNLDNKKVYPYLSSIFEVDGIKYVPVSPSERICDAIDCTYTGESYELKINKKVNYKGVDMTVREINPYTAYKCTKIKKAYIDINGNIDDKAFSECVNLSVVDIAKVEYIGNNAFSGCTNLKKVYIGNSVKAIGQEVFSDCINITQISSEAVVPPTCGINALEDINKWNCKLIVPKNSLDAYKQAYQWKDFLLIEGSTTGITNTVYNKAGLVDVYTIDGAKRLSKASTDEINALPKGVYIVNGKKIIIK